LQVRAKHDPNGVFLNDHLKKVFGVWFNFYLLSIEV
jgi:hypothetical protein